MPFLPPNQQRQSTEGKRELITMTDYYHWKSPMSVSGRGILSGVQVSTGGCVTTCVITLLH